MILSSLTATEDCGNVWILSPVDRGLGKYVDPLSCRQRIGEMIEYFVTMTEDWGNDRSLCHDDIGKALILCDSDRVLGKYVDPLSPRQRIWDMIAAPVTTT